MRIKSLAQGENILMLGFEPSTFCIQNRHSNHYTNCSQFEINVGVDQGSVLSPPLFAIVIDVGRNKIKEGTLQEILYTDDIVLIDVGTNKIKEGTLQEILYKDDIVLIAVSMAELMGNFYGWKSALESKGLKVNLMKIKKW